MNEKEERIKFAWRLAEEVKKVLIGRNQYHNACHNCDGVVESTYAVYSNAAIDLANLILGNKNMLIRLLCGNEKDFAERLVGISGEPFDIPSGLPDDGRIKALGMFLTILGRVNNQ